MAIEGVVAAALAILALVGWRIRAATRAERSLLATILNSVGTDIATTDVQGAVTRWSGAAEAMLGWRAVEVVGCLVESLVAPGERQRVARGLEKLRRDPRSWQGEIAVLRRDGMSVTVAIAASPVFEGSELVGLVLLAVDTSDHGRTVEALREREHQLAEAQRMARLGSWAWDIPSANVAWSDETFHIFGLQPGALRLCIEDVLRRIHPEDRPAVEAATRLALEGAETRPADFRILRPDGTVRWVHGRTSVIEHDEAGSPSRLMGTIQDVTDAVRTAAELVAARDAAVAASTAKSEFLAIMSHEIRTPLNAVIGLIQLLVDTSLNEDQRQLADGVDSAGEALLALINDILDFAKIEAGHLELEVDDLDVGELVADVGELVASAAWSKGLELIVSWDPALSTGRRGDRARLRQVLVNLAANAVKFTDQGEVVIRAQAEAKDQVRFEVSDTGSGIAPEDQERLFEPFVQSDGSTTRRHEGSGLGLAISRRLVEAMDGVMGVESRVGKGSTFWLTVPLPDTRGVRPRQRAVALEGIRALVVDDNVTNRAILQRHLSAWGVSVVSVPDGPLALDRLTDAAMSGEPFDVALVDMVMPGMSGIEVAAAVAAHPGLGRVPVVLVSSGLEVDAAAGTRVGVAACLTKPVRPSLLQAVLLRILAPPLPDAAPARPTPGAAHRGRVLVAEDNELNRRVVTGMLERLGYEVDLAVDGAEAVAAVAQQSYDAVVMDFHMPNVDGLEATRRIRAAETARGRRLPVIALTAAAFAEDRERCLAAGMDDYVAKPVRRDQMERALQRACLRASSGLPARPRGSADPVLDPDQLASHGDSERQGSGLMAELLRCFAADAPVQLARLRAAISDLNMETVQSAAHTLKGSAATLGAPRVVSACTTLEAAVREGEEGVLPTLLGRLEGEVSDAIAALGKIVATAPVTVDPSRPELNGV